MKFRKGATDPIGDDGKFLAGIHCDMWYQRIAVLGDNQKDAEEFRDEVLNALLKREEKTWFIEQLFEQEKTIENYLSREAENVRSHQEDYDDLANIQDNLREEILELNKTNIKLNNFLQSMIRCSDACYSDATMKALVKNIKEELKNV